MAYAFSEREERDDTADLCSRREGKGEREKEERERERERTGETI